MYWFWDSTMILLIPAIALAIYAQSKVRGAYAKYSQVLSRRGMTGAQAARSMLDRNGMSDVNIEMAPGVLTDHYDPRGRVMRLSEGVYRSSSLAALGIAAHETGHAVQHNSGYYPLALRNGFVPVASFGSKAAFPLFLIGLIFHTGWMLDLGIILFAAAVAFHLVTLPVELNASRRAIRMLAGEGYLTDDEVEPARSVLNAAAWTYVAAAAMAVMQLLRMLMLRDRR